MIRIAICDDELKPIQTISKYLDTLALKYHGIKYEAYRSGDDLFAHFERGDITDYYDLIFLDIEMDGMNGIDAAMKIREYDSRVLIIYITSFEEFVFKAADTFMFRYLLKPLEQKQFNRVFEDAYKTINKRGKTFNFKLKYDPTCLPIERIVYFERVGRRLVVHTTKGVTDPFWGKISEIEKELEPYGFIKPHKSFLVNMRFIYTFKATHLTLSDHKTTIPISNNERANVRKTFMDHHSRSCNL